MALAEMYVQGVSTRKVAAITETLYGTQVSASQVSRAAEQLDETLQEWRTRPLGVVAHLYLDARYEKVRQSGSVQDAAILIASSVKRDRKRSILGISVSLSEAEPYWRAFLEELVKRGLMGVKLIVSNNHKKLEAARKAIFTGISWQRCQFHLQQNAQASYQEWACARRQPKTFESFSTLLTGKQLRPTRRKQLEKTRCLRPYLQTGWRSISRGRIHSFLIPQSTSEAFANF